MPTSGSGSHVTVVLAHGGHVVPSVLPGTAVLRWVVLIVAASAAAWLLRRDRTGAAVLLSSAASLVCTTSPALVVHRTAVTLWLAAVVAWVAGSRHRGTTATAVTSTSVVTVTGLWLAAGDRVRPDDLLFDRLVLLKAGLLVGAVALALRRRTRLELALLLVAAAVGSALVLVPTAPPAGRPLVSAAGDLPVTVVPQRPGTNWVHVDTDRVVTVDGVRAGALPGTTGQWARVTLPAGRSSLRIKEIGHPWERLLHGDVLVDAGHGTPVTLDGPECVSAWTAGALRARTPLGCPSQQLTGADAGALENLVAWLARRHVTGITVVGDSTPRSVRAQQLLTAARTRLGLSDRGALVVTSGWERADAQLARAVAPQDGVYLAPWLASGPFLSRYGELAPLAVLPFDPSGPQALRYAAALPTGEIPTAAGFAAWGGAVVPARVYASAPVSIFPAALGHEHPSGGWFPGGALTDVSGRLQPAAPERAS
jgi:hypothetical protein